MGPQEQLKEKALDITRILTGLKLSEALEVLANVLIFEGLARLNAPAQSRENLIRVMDYVTQDVKLNGSNLVNSTVLLGIDLLTALNKDYREIHE